MRNWLHILLTALVLTNTLTATAGSTQHADTLQRYSAEQLMDMGRRHFERRYADQAMACFNEVVKRYENGDSIGTAKLAIRALNNSACVYKYFYQDYIKAYDRFTQAYQLCEQQHDDEFLPVIMVNFGDLINDYGTSYNSKAMSQQAQDMFEKCMEQGAKTGNWELMATAFFNLSNQNYTLPLERYQRLFDKHIPDSTPDLQYVRLQYRGIEALQQGNYGEARRHFLQQLPAVSARWEPERDTLATYMNIAYTYHLEGKYSQEIAFLEKALDMANAQQIDDQAKSIDHLLTEAQTQQLSERQMLQQVTILVIAVILLVVVTSAALLWQKNRQLQLRNRSLYQKNLQLLHAEQEARQLRKGYGEQQHKDLEAGKYSRSSLNDEQRSALIYRIQEVLSDPTVICQPDFTLAKLAKMVDSNTTYASQVINEKYGTAFSNVLSGHRIKEACRRMSDETALYAQITIEAIGLGVGFRSRTAFINAFKREVGLTPSEYMRMAQSQKEGENS